MEDTGSGIWSSRYAGITPRIERRLDPGWVRDRFDRIAGLYRFFELLYLVPAKLRPLAVERLALLPGDRALSVGCGQGRSLPLMAAAVGPAGHVTGVDLSARMLRYARERLQRNGIHTVSVIHGDIRNYRASAPLDAVLFSFSLTTFGDPNAVLQHVWEQLRPGGRLVVADAHVPPRAAFLLKPIMPLIHWFQEATVLGDPAMHPIEELGRLGPRVHVQRSRGFYFIATVIKPAS